jgi:hypothetical protein
MAGIRQADIAIKTMIDLSVEDMRRNPWLIQHMLSDLVNISYFKDKYGQKQIDACQEWFKNNQIDVFHVLRFLSKAAKKSKTCEQWQIKALRP